MREFFLALTQYTFLQNALLGGLLAGLGCGLIGPFVVVRRIGFLAGGIAHAVLGGMGIAYFLGRSPLVGAFAAAVVAALIIGWVNLHFKERVDTLVSALWSVGMAVGILFISRTPGYNVDLMSYLFGNILMIGQEALWLMVVLDGIILIVLVLFFKQFLAVSFDEEFARLRGVRVELFSLGLLIMVALSVVLLIQIVGLILVLALLTLPAAIAGHYTRTLRAMMVGAVILAMLFTTGGLALSYGPDLPVGATIILLAGGAYLLSTILAAVQRHYRKS
jgi:zinc transport system permease protein